MDDFPRLTRRALLRGAAVGALGSSGALGFARVPAWAKPPARHGGLRHPDSLPLPHLPAGHSNPALEKIEHVVVLMMENHSFDNLLGMAPHQIPGRHHLDGFHFGHRGRPINWNPSQARPVVHGPRVYATAASSPCQQPAHPNQDWNASHLAWNGGRNDGFVQAGTAAAMWYWDGHDLPFTYSLVEHFPVGERYFASVLAQTYPNRRFLFCGTASGLTATSNATYTVPAANGTIFDRLLHHGISWKNYVQPTGGTLQASPLIVPNFANSQASAARILPISQFYADAHAGALPAFSLIDPNYSVYSEENPQDIQAGEGFLASVVSALMRSRQWSRTALFLTWDEHGGYYDHVPPPRAIAPDGIAPRQSLANEQLVPGGYDRYGFRVPMIVVSPWARANYSSRVVQDHTSILAFLEHRWNLPALTFRDANAHPMTDYFDFRRPAFLKPPKLAAAPTMAVGLQQCAAAGLTPPPGTPVN